MERPNYLSTHYRKQKFFHNFYKNKPKETNNQSDIATSFPQKRKRFSENLISHPISQLEGIEEFYKYVDKLQDLLEVLSNHPLYKTPYPTNKLSTFVQALNSACKLNPTQLKVCRNFGVNLESDDLNETTEINTEQTPRELMPIDSFIGKLPEKYTPWTLPTKMEIIRLVPPKYAKIV